MVLGKMVLTRASFVLVLLFAACSSPSTRHADEQALHGLVAKRRQILGDICADLRKRNPRGQTAAGDIAVMDAEIAYYAFTRDTAGTLEDQLKEHGKLAAVEAERVKLFEAMYADGKADIVDVLRARDRSSAAMQTLYELRLRR